GRFTPQDCAWGISWNQLSARKGVLCRGSRGSRLCCGSDRSPRRSRMRVMIRWAHVIATAPNSWASRIAEEVIAHLTRLAGSDVSVTLEIEARVPGGVPANVVRTVTENGRTLRFSSQ